jgi:phage-related protein
MTAPIVPNGSGSRTRPKVDVGQLWPGGVATAIVAGLVALVGVLVCR